MDGLMDEWMIDVGIQRQCLCMRRPNPHNGLLLLSLAAKKYWTGCNWIVLRNSVMRHYIRLRYSTPAVSFSQLNVIWSISFKEYTLVCTIFVSRCCGSWKEVNSNLSSEIYVHYILNTTHWQQFFAHRWWWNLRQQWNGLPKTDRRIFSSQ